MENFITIKENVTAEITEKKSKFIVNLIKVKNKEEAENEINKIKKEYHDARHNCIAYSNKIFWRNIIRNRRLSKSIFRSNTKINRKIRKNRNDFRNRNGSKSRI